MSCHNAHELISQLLDGRLAAVERENVEAHAAICRECGWHLAFMQRQRAELQKLPPAQMPEDLATRLSVLASHECERRAAHASIRERLRRLAMKADLVFQNLMRPVAVPVTGGVFSTLLLFALMMPSLSFSHPTGGYDFSTAPQGSIVVNPWDLGATDDNADFPVFANPDEPQSDYVNIVNLTIDESGRVADWSVVRGQVTDEMKSIILYSRFVPATTFGVRTSGVIQVRQSLPPCKYTSCSATVRG